MSNIVHRITWSVPTANSNLSFGNHGNREMYKLFASKEKADAFYEELMHAIGLLGMTGSIEIKYKEMNLE